MKKLLIGAIALAGLLTVSCNKEVNSPDPTPAKNLVVMTFQASVSDATRTAYANEKTFSWSAGDEIRVRLYDPATDAYSWANFATEEGGATASFSATVEEGLEFGGLAYHNLGADELTDDYDGVPCAWVEYALKFAELEDPLSIVPLVGLQVPGSNNLEFQTAVGIIKMPIKNIPEDVDEIVVYANEDAGNTLCGLYSLEGYGAISQEDATGYAYPDLWIYPDVDADGHAVIYVPVPVGTLYAGLEVQFYAGETMVALIATEKDVEVARNAFITFPAIDVTENLVEETIYSVPVLWDFEDGADGWTFIDADKDGNDWRLAGLATVSGNYCLASESYINNVGALTPDNWAFTPPVELGEGNNYLSFWVRAQDPDYGAEHYAVYITTGEPSVEAELLMEETEYPDGDAYEWYYDELYQHFVIAIPKSYNGQVVRIGFRHFNCTDMFVLDIDDVAILDAIPDPLPPLEFSEEYEKWLGTWTFNDGVKEEKWTIEANTDGATYTLTGIGYSFISVQAIFNEEDNSLEIECQDNIYSENGLILHLYGQDEEYYYTDGTLAKATLVDDDNANLVDYPGDDVEFAMISLLGGEGGAVQYSYGNRYLPATLTRVQEVEPSSSPKKSAAAEVRSLGPVSPVAVRANRSILTNKYKVVR